jgi:hypothetical protein
MISKFFIERPILANVIAIITMIWGAISLYNLPVSKYPEIAPPTIQVATIYPGASAETIGNTVGIPIEQAVNGVENAIYQSSTSGSDGTYVLTITFKVGSNLNTALLQVQNMVNGAIAKLPETVQRQGISVKKVSTNILQVISLYSEDDHFDDTYLSNYAVINLKYPLARIPGMGEIKIFGAGSYSMRIWLNPERLKFYSLTVNDIVTAIKQNNVEMVAGMIGGAPVSDEQSMQFTINGLGRLTEAVEFENIIIKSSRDMEKNDLPKIVRVKDLARVELSQQGFTNFAKINDHKAAHIISYTIPGSNAIEVGDQIRKAMLRMSQDFPKGLKYGIFYDTTQDIKESINAVYETLAEAGILVLIVIMVFLQNWRATLVPATTVPVTIIGAFGAMAMMGFSVNLMTLFALILAVGIVVDDAVVIVENASHYIEKGLSPKDASIKAMEEMTGPVLGITLVLIAVFLPPAFLPGIAGELFRQFTFFFAPGADPWHTAITPWQHEFHKLMGSGNAALFNQKFRLYFTKENFDLFYPSYGDTWPLFNGAMGFTYEQSGGGGSGLAIKLESGDTLTLKDRIDGHFTASMATLKVAYENREKLVSGFNTYFEESEKNPSFQYKSVIIKGSNEKSNIESLLQLFDRNQIRYSYAGGVGKKMKGFDYTLNKDGEVTIEKGDILISAYQPQSHLMQVLFEPDSKTIDSLSYDLTAWALPYIYNLKAFALTEKISPDTGKVEIQKIRSESVV